MRSNSVTRLVVGRLVIGPDGATTGIISGGCLEREIAHHARRVLRSGRTDMIDVRDPSTAVIPNATSTGASIGTTYAAEGAKRVCEMLRSRLMDFGYRLLKEQGDEWCRKHVRGCRAPAR